MAFEYKQLTEIMLIGNTITTIFANPVSKTSYGRCLILFNSHTSAVNVKLYKVPDSTGSVGTAAYYNQFFEVDMLSKETILFEPGIPGLMLVDTNDSIRGIADVNNVVTIQIFGGQE